MKRQFQMAKRRQVKPVEVSPEKDQHESPELKRKYDNGKPKK